MKDELTQVDIDKMKEEIEYRRSVLAPKWRDAIKSAKEQGDLSENDEYHSARREWRNNESRIAYLEAMIKSAIVVSTDTDVNTIGLFDNVTLYYVEDDETEVIRVVTTLRNDPSKGNISKESPLGKAVLGAHKGDTVTVNVNDTCSYEVKIVDFTKGEDDASLEISKF